MNNNNDAAIGVLNDLIRINNDRVEGYRRASEEIKETDGEMHSLFLRFANESRQYEQELSAEVRKLGGDPANGTTVSGKIYRVWMDLKATVQGKDRKTALESCEFGEDAAQKAYNMALDDAEKLPVDLVSLVQRQKAQLRAAHDQIKSYRDVYQS